MSEGITEIFGWLLSATDTPFQESAATSLEWKKHFLALLPNWSKPVDMAIAGGFTSNRIAFAFASGYASALRALVPSLPEGKIASFCITENKSTRPADMGTSLDVPPSGSEEQGARELTGRKDFVSLAQEADLFLTAAVDGCDERGRNRIRMVMLDRGMRGITIKPMEDLSFVPEISHGIMECSRVMVSQSDILPGDGYSEYIRPFRMIEDMHVYAALLGYLLRVAFRYSWPRDIRERIFGLMAGVKCIASAAPDDPAVISAGGFQKWMNDLFVLTEPLWERVDPEERRRWERDRVLFNVAEKARTARLEKAWVSAGMP